MRGARVGLGWRMRDVERDLDYPQTVAADGIHTLQCTATSTGGTRAGTITIKRDTVPPAVPAIGGIKPQTYLAGAVPAKSALRCTSSDATSGLAGCSLTSFPVTLAKTPASTRPQEAQIFIRMAEAGGRAVERKKPGRPGARKRFQFSKR